MSHGGLVGFFTGNWNSERKLPHGVQKVYDRVRRDLVPVGVCYEGGDHELISETIERDEKGREYRLQTVRVRPEEDVKSDDEAYQQWERRHKRCRPAACADVFEAAAAKTRRRLHIQYRRGEGVMTRRVPILASFSPAHSKTGEQEPASKKARKTPKKTKKGSK